MRVRRSVVITLTYEQQRLVSDLIFAHQQHLIEGKANDIGMEDDIKAQLRLSSSTANAVAMAVVLP